MKLYIEQLINKESLLIDEMKDAIQTCLTSDVSDAEIAALLIALRAKGETADEITGIVEVIRSQSELHSIKLPNIMDNCGTGGDHSHSFNISTTASFIIAGAGTRIAKHGNRSVSSKTGSADVLEALGVSLSFSKDHIEEMLYENQIAFLYAPHVHVNLKRFMKVRKDLGLPTVFNTIGPLTNPVPLDSQLIGVYKQELLYLLANSLKKLGRQRAVIVNGAGGMDEASLAGENQLLLLEEGKITSFTVHPEQYNLPVYSQEAIRGGSAKENAAILLDVLNGKPGAYLDTALLNAGLGLYANGAVHSIEEGLRLAKESIYSGNALKRLDRLVEYSKKTRNRGSKNVYPR